MRPDFQDRDAVRFGWVADDRRVTVTVRLKAARSPAATTHSKVQFYFVLSHSIEIIENIKASVNRFFYFC
jgi:hypothetical protein